MCIAGSGRAEERDVGRVRERRPMDVHGRRRQLGQGLGHAHEEPLLPAHLPGSPPFASLTPPFTCETHSPCSSERNVICLGERDSEQRLPAPQPGSCRFGVSFSDSSVLVYTNCDANSVADPGFWNGGADPFLPQGSPCGPKF